MTSEDDRRAEVLAWTDYKMDKTAEAGPAVGSHLTQDERVLIPLPFHISVMKYS